MPRRQAYKVSKVKRRNKNSKKWLRFENDSTDIILEGRNMFNLLTGMTAPFSKIVRRKE